MNIVLEDDTSSEDIFSIKQSDILKYFPVDGDDITMSENGNVLKSLGTCERNEEVK